MDHPDYFSALNYSEIVKDYPLGAAFDQTFRSMSRDELRARQDKQFKTLMKRA